MILISATNRSFQTFPCAAQQSKTRQYFDRLIEDKLIDPNELTDQAIEELESKIAITVTKFEYELYHGSVYDDLDVSKLELQPFELFDILQENDENSIQRMIKYFVVGKLRDYERLTVLDEQRAAKASYKLERHKSLTAVQDKSGLWNYEDQLVYGLWHNTLFAKFRRSNVSKLYERRVYHANVLDDNNKVVIDLDWCSSLNYFRLRKLATQIRILLGYNKYHSKYPYKVEFVHSKPLSSSFDNLLGRVMPQWKESFPYPSHTKPISKVYPPQKLFYLTPTAEKPITMEEISNPENILVFPGYVSASLRDPMFRRINSIKWASVRRLPTTEHLVWNQFHGVLSMNTVFSIIQDLRQNSQDTWEAAFKRHLPVPIIKSETELLKTEKERSKLFAKKQEKKQQFQQKWNDTPFKSYAEKYEPEKWKKKRK